MTLYVLNKSVKTLAYFLNVSESLKFITRETTSGEQLLQREAPFLVLYHDAGTFLDEETGYSSSGMGANITRTPKAFTNLYVCVMKK